MATQIGIKASDAAVFSIFGAILLALALLCMVAAFFFLRGRVADEHLRLGTCFGLAIVVCAVCPYACRRACGVPQLPKRQRSKAEDQLPSTAKSGEAKEQSTEARDSAAGVGVARSLDFGQPLPKLRGWSDATDVDSEGSIGSVSDLRVIRSASDITDFSSPSGSSSPEPALKPIVVDTKRLQRDEAYKSWYMANRLHILEHNKRAFAASATPSPIRRQGSGGHRAGQLLRDSPTRQPLTPNGMLSRSRHNISMHSATRRSSADMPPEEGQSGSGGKERQPSPLRQTSRLASTSPLLLPERAEPLPEADASRAKQQGTFQVDEERLANDPAYQAWFEQHKHKLQALRTATTTMAVLGALRRNGPSNKPATPAAAVVVEVNPARPAFQVDQERLRSDEAYRAWFEAHKHKLGLGVAQQSVEGPSESTTASAARVPATAPGQASEDAAPDPTSFQFSNPLVAKRLQQRQAHQRAASTFQVDQERLGSDAAYRAWYEAHKHKLG